jgi:hypothetical protein
LRTEDPPSPCGLRRGVQTTDDRGQGAEDKKKIRRSEAEKVRQNRAKLQLEKRGVIIVIGY